MRIHNLKTCRLKFKFLKNVLTIRKSRCLKKNWSMKKLQLWPKSWEHKPLMDVRALLRLLRRSMSTKRERRSYQERCLPLYLNFPCSKVKPSNCNRKKRRKNKSLKTLSQDLRKVCHQPTLSKLNGQRRSETSRERSRTESKDFRESNWKCLCHQMVSKQLHSQDQTHTCLQIFRSQDLTVVSNHSNQRNQVQTCVTLSSQSQWR